MKRCSQIRMHRLEGGDGRELVEEAEAQGQGDELYRLLEDRRHEEAQPVAAPARQGIHSPRAIGARASRMSMRARRSTICTMT